MADVTVPSTLRLLVSAKDIADLFLETTDIGEAARKTRASIISNWRARHASFPFPVIGGHNAQFDLDDIIKWAQRDDTPARRVALPVPPTWWWAKTVDALRTELGMMVGRTGGDPLRAYLCAVILLRAALVEGVAGVRTAPRRWEAIRSSADLSHAAGALEKSNSAFTDLLVDAIGGVQPATPVVTDLLRRLDDVAHDGLTAPEQFDVVVDTTPAHPRQIFSATATELAQLVANAAMTAPGETVYDPCAGEGQLLLACAAENSAIVFQERDTDASRIARTRFLLHGHVPNFGRPDQSSIDEDQFPNLRADVVVADPPVTAMLPLVAWVDHALAHLADRGRCVITIPAHAITVVDKARRKPEHGLQQRLVQLAREGNVKAVSVVASRLRRDVTGPITIWELTNNGRTGTQVKLRSGSARSGQSSTQVTADNLLDQIREASVGQTDGPPTPDRPQPPPNPDRPLLPPTPDRPVAAKRIEDALRALETLEIDLGPLLDRLATDDVDLGARVRQVRRDLGAVEDALRSLP